MEREQLHSHIEALLSPSIYPRTVDRVELIQAHISYANLAGNYVYKVKRPNRHGLSRLHHAGGAPVVLRGRGA
jgi:hypothetical protein